MLGEEVDGTYCAGVAVVLDPQPVIANADMFPHGLKHFLEVEFKECEKVWQSLAFPHDHLFELEGVLA